MKCWIVLASVQKKKKMAQFLRMKKNEIGFVYLKIQFQKSRIVKVLS